MSISAAQMAALTGMYENAGSLQKREIEQRYKLGKDQISNSYKIAQMESKDRRAGIEATREYQRGQLAQAIAEMERVDIPRMEIERYAAEKNYEIAQGELTYKREALAEDRRQYEQTFAEQARQFEKTYGLQEGALTGYLGGRPTLERQQFEEGIRQWEKEYGLQEGQLTGYLNGLPTLEREQWLAAHGLAEAAHRLAEAEVTGTYQGQDTLERQRFLGDEAERQRRYALDVAQYGTELASQPDRYFQARRFAALDAPRLLGQDTSGVAGPAGGPTPQLQTMGALLSGGGDARLGPGSAYGGPAGGSPMLGADPNLAPGSAYGVNPDAGRVYAGGASGFGEGGGGGGGGDAALAPGSAYGGPSAAGAGGGGMMYAGGADERYKQIAQIAKAAPPSPYDGLDEQDTAALKLMESVYKRGGQGIAGGELERMGTSGRAFLGSAGRLLGYDPEQLQHEYLSYRPTQGSSALAG